MDLRDRLLQRFKQAGPVVPFPSKHKVPTQVIHGRRYVLSDYWPMGAGVSEDMAPEGGGGARLITGPGNRWRYLWLYDTERQILAMWRHSDGNEKFHDKVREHAHNVYTLEKKGQLNRVTREEFVTVEREMRKREDDTIKALQKSVAESATDWDRKVNEILDTWFSRNVEPSLNRRLAELDKGVTPLGFKVNPALLEHGKNAEQQARQWLVTKSLEGFDQSAAYDVVSKVVGFDAYNPPEGDPQAVQWAWGDFLERVFEKYELRSRT